MKAAARWEQPLLSRIGWINPEGFRAGDDLEDLSGNGRLTGFVV